MSDWAPGSPEERAEELIAERGYSPTVARLAADEPLYRLRDALAIDGPLTPRFNLPGFRVIDSVDNVLENRDPEDPLELNATIRGTDIHPHLYPQRRSWDLLQLMGRRIAILERSAVGNIWLHRELVRAGLAETQLDPIPFYYVHGRKELALIRDWGGLRLGIVPVAILQEHLEMLWTNSGLKLKQDQLESLALDPISFQGLQLLFAGEEPPAPDVIRRPLAEQDPDYDPLGFGLYPYAARGVGQEED